MEVSGQFLGPAALPQGKEPPVSTGWKAGCTPEHVWTLLLLPETEARLHTEILGFRTLSIIADLGPQVVHQL
jgi:hypothetical protein